MDQKDENPVTYLDLRTPEEWGKVKGIRVIDPDGWRGEHGLSWETPITEEDYDNRAAVSSINMKTADQSPFYSEVVADHRTPAGYRAPRGARRADTAPVSLFPNSDAELEEKQRQAFDRHASMGLTHGIARLADQQAYDYAASTISPEFARALAPGHPDADEDGPISEHEMDDEAATADTPNDRHEDRSEPLWSQAGYDSEGEWITAGRP